MRVYSHIYQLYDATGCRYVGQTISSLEKRKSDHISCAKRGEDTYKSKWIRATLASGGDINISSVDSGEWSQAERNEREIYWIAEYRRRGARLTNTTDGGFGHIPNAEERARISKKTKEAMARPEIKAKIKKLKPISCLICETVFEPRRSITQTCSFKCGQTLATKMRTGRFRVDRKTICKNCNKVFERKGKNQSACGTSCAGALRGKLLSKPYPSGTCILCGNSFPRTRKNRARKTCSNTCRYKLVVERRKEIG